MGKSSVVNEMLQQVMLNLILDAVEGMVGVDAEVRKLVICTESSPSEGLLVTVGDSGPGIALEDRDRIFESFYTTKASGVGIGLSICRSIFDAHGGRLWRTPICLAAPFSGSRCQPSTKPRFSAPNQARRLTTRWLKAGCETRAAIVRVATKRSYRSTTAQ